MSVSQKLWRRTFGEASCVKRYGDFRTREQFGLIDRQNYLYGMLRAADVATYFGIKRVTAIEFGVASGAGLLNMIALADQIKDATGVTFRIVGFDTGSGLPAVTGYKDHPEIWSPGDFAMQDRDGLLRKIDDRATIIWGDIAETVKDFTATVNPAEPIGFVSVDVDIHSATQSALRCLSGPPQNYVPAISMYFDDVGFFFANEWAGELAAIREFNDQSPLRKIDRDRSLPGRRPIKAASWYQHMYVCHLFDHEARQKPPDRTEMTIGAHADFMVARHLF